MIACSRKPAITLAILLILTIVTAKLADASHATFLILGIAFVKTLLVAFRFMDLRRAHLFWKLAVVLLLITILTSISLIHVN